MSEKTNIDNAIREKFENFSVEPPAHLWGEISGELAADKKRKRRAVIGWIAAAAVVVIAFLAGWLINDHSNQVLPSMAEQPKVQEIIQNPTESMPQSRNIEIQDQKEQAVAAFKAQPESSESETQNHLARTYMAENGAKNSETEQTLLTTGVREEWNVESLPFINAEFDQEAETLKTSVPQEHQLPIQNTFQNDQAVMASNIQKLQEKSKPDHGWVVGALLSPGYSAHTSSYSTSYSSNMSNNLEGGVQNLGGGVSVQYKTGKKIRIESGVYYAQNSQSSGSASSLFSMSSDFEYLSGDVVSSGGDPVYSNTVGLQQDGMVLNSIAGVVNLSKTPQGAELAANADDALTTATLITSGDFAQEFDFIEIPVYLRYRVVDKKVGVDLMGGLNAGIVVGNNVYLSNQYGKQNVGTTEDISTLNLSGTVGVGVSYALGRHFSLSLEPRMNYYLNSISTNPEVSYKPYRFGLFSGIYYAF